MSVTSPSAVMTISTVTAARSTPGRRLQRSEDRRGGSIGSTIRARRRTCRAGPPRGRGGRPPGRTARRRRCGPTRRVASAPSGVTAMASSWSLAPSGSMVMTRWSRRSRRPRSRDGASSSWAPASSRTARGKGIPSALAASRARRAARGEHAEPWTAVTRPARPRIVTVTRSPTSAPSRAPLARGTRSRLEGRLGRRTAPRRHQLRDEHRRGASSRAHGTSARAWRRPRCSTSSAGVCGSSDTFTPGGGRASPGRTRRASGSGRW